VTQELKKAALSPPLPCCSQLCKKTDYIKRKMYILPTSLQKQRACKEFEAPIVSLKSTMQGSENAGISNMEEK
jgi:hypothetical protein